MLVVYQPKLLKATGAPCCGQGAGGCALSTLYSPDVAGSTSAEASDTHWLLENSTKAGPASLLLLSRNISGP